VQTNRNVHTNWSSRTATEFAVFAATYGRESWTLRKNEEICLDAFEMKGLRKIPLNYIARKSQAYLLAAYLHVLNVDSKKRLFLWLLSIDDCNVS